MCPVSTLAGRFQKYDIFGALFKGRTLEAFPTHFCLIFTHFGHPFGALAIDKLVAGPPFGARLSQHGHLYGSKGLQMHQHRQQKTSKCLKTIPCEL